MKKILIPLFTVAIIVAASCSSSQLYHYENYNSLTYSYIKNPNDETLNALLKVHEKIITNPKGTRETPPPGMCADYGFLLIQKGEVEKGKQMLQKEIELYPESSIFVGLILKRFENQ